MALSTPATTSGIFVPSLHPLLTLPSPALPVLAVEKQGEEG